MCVPTSGQLFELVQIWVDNWVKQVRKQGNDEVGSVCDRFLAATENPPPEWDWRAIDPKSLIQDLNTQNGLAYQAVPSLLATLLHGKTCTITTRQGTQNIQWRKVQGFGGDKVGLCLVSQPFRATYINKEKEREGYFAYRLDFLVQNQAGRFYSSGNLKPWIFLKLSCQRYAHERLEEPNYDRNISVLVGMNEARLLNYSVDSTLVRLVVKNVKDRQIKGWNLQLSALLSAFKARELTEPEDILDNPLRYTRFGDLNPQSDEYYVVHAEGYKYKPEKYKRGHSLKTGFSFDERRDIVSQVLTLLNEILIPDAPIQDDKPTPKGKTAPLALRSHEYIQRPRATSSKNKNEFSEAEKQELNTQHRKKRQKILLDAYQRVLRGETVSLFILWYEKETYNAINHQLREVFLLDKDEGFPKQIKVHSIFIDQPSLLEPLSLEGIEIQNRSLSAVIKSQHQSKCQAWRLFLKRHISKNLTNRFAIIEIRPAKRKGIRPEQNIKGTIREACALEDISSQMIQTVKQRADADKNDGARIYTSKTQGRILQSVLDSALRQPGILYGPPAELYPAVGLPAEICPSLAIIALCRCQNRDGGVHYAIAVRLRATGTVDIMLPDKKIWIPYHQAGYQVGKIFSKARGDQRKKPGDSKVNLKRSQLASFAAHVTTQALESPTLVLIKADGWRNARSRHGDGAVWPQLQNGNLANQQNVLDFNHVVGHKCEYQRNDTELNNLLAVIRLRDGKETPQYIPNLDAWGEDDSVVDFAHLSGFCDTAASELFHYFSVGRLPITQKQQKEKQYRDLYMLDENGATVAFKHQQIVEMLPFFVRSDFQNDEGLRSLCRCLHYLRTSPAWTMGNIHSPYPMHLGHRLIDDQLCILGVNN